MCVRHERSRESDRRGGNRHVLIFEPSDRQITARKGRRPPRLSLSIGRAGPLLAAVMRADNYAAAAEVCGAKASSTHAAHAHGEEAEEQEFGFS